MPFQIIRNDITKVKADAIVNTANPFPVIGSGTDSAVYRAAGREELLEERRKIGSIARGQAVSTPAFHLQARYIIHTVGPSWVDGKKGEGEILHACYANSLALAAELGCESVAFPLISSGSYRFPKERALQIALAEISSFLLNHDMEVILVVFDERSFALSGRLVGQIEEYIDEHEVKKLRREEYSSFDRSERPQRLYQARRKETFSESDAAPPFWKGSEDYGSLHDASKLSSPVFAHASAPAFMDESLDASEETELDASVKTLDELVRSRGETFQERLFHLIDQSGMDDVTVYKNANIDRKVFSRIRCNQDYQPSKKTAIAFAIALKLDLPATNDLLSRAGMALSPSSRFDLIIAYFVSHGIYDIFEINAALFKYNQPILGG